MKTHGLMISLAFLGASFIWACAEPQRAPTAPGSSMGIQSAVAGAVTICHLPLSNPGIAHTMAISANAVSAHLAHGDLLGACGLIGTWRVTSMVGNGVEYLPASLSAVFTVRSDGTYLESISGDTDSLFCEGTQTSCSQEYTYIDTGNTVVFCDPGCDEYGDYVIAGRTMTYSLYDPDEQVAWTLTFKRIG